MPTISVEQLESARNLNLGYSRWITLDQARIDAFADLTEDRQWIHTDPARASSGPFGTTIAHGYLSLSLVSALVDDMLEITGQTASVNYGLNRVRFPSPVPAGSRVRAHGEIVGVSRVSSGLEVLINVEVLVDGMEKPAVVAEAVFRVS